MRGNRKPTARKKLEGTERKDRANPAEPQYEAAVPPPPYWLTPSALEAWHYYAPRLHGQRLLAEVDQALLAGFCEMVAEVAWLTGLLADGQRYLLEEDGQPRKYPISEERRKAIQRMQSLGEAFGLSAQSRGKVSSIKGGKTERPAERLRRQAAERRRGEQPTEEPVH